VFAFAFVFGLVDVLELRPRADPPRPRPRGPPLPPPPREELGAEPLDALAKPGRGGSGFCRDIVIVDKRFERTASLVTREIISS